MWMHAMSDYKEREAVMRLWPTNIPVFAWVRASRQWELGTFLGLDSEEDDLALVRVPGHSQIWVSVLSVRTPEEHARMSLAC